MKEIEKKGALIFGDDIMNPTFSNSKSAHSLMQKTDTIN